MRSDSDGTDGDLHSKIQEGRKKHVTTAVFGAHFSCIEASSVLTVYFQVSDSVVQLLSSYLVEALLDVCENIMASGKHAVNFFRKTK